MRLTNLLKLKTGDTIVSIRPGKVEGINYPAKTYGVITKSCEGGAGHNPVWMLRFEVGDETHEVDFSFCDMTKWKLTKTKPSRYSKRGQKGFSQSTCTRMQFYPT